MSDLPSFNESEGITVSPQEGNTEGDNTKPSFYDQGRIADSKTAVDIAYVEKDQGRNKALAYEDVLKMAHETGLTEDERFNVELMEVFSQEFPHAFREVIDSRGQKFLAMDTELLIGDARDFRAGRGQFSMEKRPILEKTSESMQKLFNKNQTNKWGPVGTPYYILVDGPHHLSKGGITNRFRMDSLKNANSGDLDDLIEQLELLNDYNEVVKKEALENKAPTPDDIRSRIRNMREKW